MGASSTTKDARSGWLRRSVGPRIAALPPAYFAMSMATGIVSIACHWLGLNALATLLFWINIVAYVVLWAAMIARAALYPKEFVADWTSHQNGPGFFTSVAATGVLGMQFVQLEHQPVFALGLWIFALVLWFICTYTVFIALTVRENKPSLADGINGGWLLAVVATQSVTVLGCNVLPLPGSGREAMLFFLTAFWLSGGMLYIWMISLIFYRYTFFRFAPSDLMPPYWINMGAVAISTLAGTVLVTQASGSPLLASILPFVKGFTVLYWATATWWIPMLLGLGIWRHVASRLPVSYDPLYWGLVFPFGMYSVATYRLVETFDLPFLAWVARVFVVIAICAWTFTFLGLVARLMLIALTASRAARDERSATPSTHPFIPALTRSNTTLSTPGGSQ